MTDRKRIQTRLRIIDNRRPSSDFDRLRLFLRATDPSTAEKFGSVGKLSPLREALAYARHTTLVLAIIHMSNI